LSFAESKKINQKEMWESKERGGGSRVKVDDVQGVLTAERRTKQCIVSLKNGRKGAQKMMARKPAFDGTADWGEGSLKI